MRRRLRAACASVLALGVLAGTVTGSALAPLAQIVTIDEAADAPAPAAYVLDPVPLDIISISERRGLTSDTISRAIGTANSLGVGMVYGRGFTLGMRRIFRGNTVVRESQGDGWAIPMAVTSLPIGAIGDVMGRTVAAPLSQGQVVLSQSSATFHSTQVGDQIDLLTATGAIARFTVGLVVPDAVVGGTEILMSEGWANNIGATTNTRLLIYGHLDHGAVAAALAGNGLASGAFIRIERSWDADGPDATLSLMRTKQLLGEFDLYYAGLATNDWVARNAAW
ncbi:MAG: hypothetical protein WCK21_11125, partial [Actinomycetota bacterium]